MASFEFMEVFDSKVIQISFLSLITYFILFKVFNLLKHKKRLPPGPPKLPIIGNMNQLLGGAPHRALHDLAQKYGPIMHLKLGSISTIVVSSAEAAKEIVKTHDLTFANRPKIVSAKTLGYNYTDIALCPYGAYWRQLRKICILELLNAKRVESFRHVREEEVAFLVDSIRQNISKPVNLADKFFTLNHDVTTRVTFGKKFNDGFRFKAAMKEGTLLASGFHIGDFFPSLDFVSYFSGMKARVDKNFIELDSILNEIVQEHIDDCKVKESGHEDLLDVLLRVMKNEELEVPLSIDNIKAVILDMFVGGTENASNSIEWAMAELIRHPKIMAKAQAEVRRVVGTKATVQETDLHELTYMKSIIKEILRIHTPLPLLIPRESMDICSINGYKIPAKTRAIINYWAISRDPEVWDNPETFDPERFINSSIDFKGNNPEFIPFGAGRRVCPGISFAVVNMELALAALLYHFDWKLPNNMKCEDLNMDETFGLTMFKSSNLYLVPILHCPQLYLTFT